MCTNLKDIIKRFCSSFEKERDDRGLRQETARYSNLEQNLNTKKYVIFHIKKVTPAPQTKVQDKEEGRNDGNDTKAPVEIHVIVKENLKLGGACVVGLQPKLSLIDFFNVESNFSRRQKYFFYLFGEHCFKKGILYVVVKRLMKQSTSIFF